MRSEPWQRFFCLRCTASSLAAAAFSADEPRSGNAPTFLPQGEQVYFVLLAFFASRVGRPKLADSAASTMVVLLSFTSSESEGSES